MAAQQEATPGPGGDRTGQGESVTVFYGPHVRVVTSSGVLEKKAAVAAAINNCTIADRFQTQQGTGTGVSHDLRAGYSTHTGQQAEPAAKP